MTDSTSQPTDDPLLPVYQALIQQFTAIDLLLERNLQFPTLALIYGGIDAVAWLATPEGQNDQRRQFTEWAEKYLLPGTELRCASIDLYAARCGILHTLTADSKLVERGMATRLCYAWGNADPAILQAILDRSKGERGVAVHVADLAKAFRQAVLRLFEDAENNAALHATMSSKAGRFFAALGSDPKKWREGTRKNALVWLGPGAAFPTGPWDLEYPLPPRLNRWRKRFDVHRQNDQVVLLGDSNHMVENAVEVLERGNARRGATVEMCNTLIGVRFALGPLGGEGREIILN